MSKDGGPAFPVDRAERGPWRGMTLRDYFAAQFMDRAQILSADHDGGWSFENAAYHAYAMADAMLAERSKSG